MGILAGILFLVAACATAYQATPLPFRAPSSYPNATQVEQAVIGAQAFSDPKKAQEAFGFDVRGAGMLPVQVPLLLRFCVPGILRRHQPFVSSESSFGW